jgi:biopolymer transport protein ExbB
MNFLNLFLQITTAADSTTTAGKVTPPISILDLIMKGGVVMIPIGILSFLAVYIIIERYITIKRASKNTGSFMEKVKSLIIQGDVKGARAVCQATDSPIARMTDKGISRLGRPLKEIEASIEAVGKLEVYKLEKNLSVLGIIAGVAPMLGFVGTIIGVIQIFYNIAIEQNISIGGIAEGLYVKMITSAAGLIVGIFAHIGFHYLNLMLDRVIHKMEANAIEFTDLLQDNK